MSSSARIWTLFALPFAGLLLMCHAEEPRRSAAKENPSNDLVSGGGQAGMPSAPPPPTSSSGGAGGASDGLHSDVFGSGSIASTPTVVACDYSSPGCDFARVDGCCSEKACVHASGADVFDTYPVESCEALLECVQGHPGCGTKDDPLCFRNEAPGAPCLQEGYLASHEDPDGPFAWTAALMACVCGY